MWKVAPDVLLHTVLQNNDGKPLHQHRWILKSVPVAMSRGDFKSIFGTVKAIKEICNWHLLKNKAGCPAFCCPCAGWRCTKHVRKADIYGSWRLCSLIGLPGVLRRAHVIAWPLSLSRSSNTRQADGKAGYAVAAAPWVPEKEQVYKLTGFKLATSWGRNQMSGCERAGNSQDRNCTGHDFVGWNACQPACLDPKLELGIKPSAPPNCARKEGR